MKGNIYGALKTFQTFFCMLYTYCFIVSSVRWHPKDLPHFAGEEGGIVWC